MDDNNNNIRSELIEITVKINEDIIKIESLYGKIEIELDELSFRIFEHATKVDALNADITKFKHLNPYGTVVHFLDNVSIFYPWGDFVPYFVNATERKIVYSM